jgi:anhydro-N-acetylmuramic acid kinase
MTNKYYIGLMSGTSADGIDLALVNFADDTIKVHASAYFPYSKKISERISQLYTPNFNEIDLLGYLDVELAHIFAKAILQFMADQNLSTDQIIAIGNHGQTIRHRPMAQYPFTLQIGCCQTLATLTNIRVVGQFRRKDMALGGQGAPLVPAFHQQLFADNNNDVVVLNIGGIANITFIPAQCNNQQNVMGFDTGPGNALLDSWFELHHPKSTCRYDNNGEWASQGKLIPELLTTLLSDAYFQLSAPKSTGREYFNLQWLNQYLCNNYNPEDIQATLTALTAESIAEQIKKLTAQAKIYIFGGGFHNKPLKNQLIQTLTNYEFIHSYQKDITTDNLEAVAFSWLAFAYDKKIYGNIPAVTGARSKAVLGTAFYP